MCEYCGCQDIPAIGQLTDEHDAIVAVMSHVRSALDAGQVDAAAHWSRRITTLLVPHTAVEEEGLFPALAGEFPDHVATLRGEHRAVETVLDEAAACTPTDPTWPYRLTEALYLLREHILKEQNGMFPAALTSLDPADWDVMAAVRERVGTALEPEGTRA